MLFCSKLLLLLTGKIMRHCIVLRGLDPNWTEFDLYKNLDKAFSSIRHTQAYDNDFEFKALKYKEISDKFPQMTEEQYNKLIDLHNYSDNISELQVTLPKDNDE